MKIIDVFTYNGEKDLLNIHLNILKDHVDQFIVVEARTTFSGKSKEIYFPRHIADLGLEHLNIIYHVIDENYSEDEMFLAESSPNTQGAAHWKNEFLQKESIKKALTHLNDDDMVFIGDVDEIVYPNAIEAWKKFTGSPFKIKLDVYTYFLNNRSNEKFYGTLCSKYKFIKNKCLNHLRTNAWKTNFYGGWHFTSMGGLEEVRRKLSDSYTEESYWNKNVQDSLELNIEHGKDFLGRNFIYKIDESEWPSWLVEHREDYKHLLKTYDNI